MTSSVADGSTLVRACLDLCVCSAPASLLRRGDTVLEDCWMDRNCGGYYYPNDPDAPKYKVALVECQGVPDQLCLSNNVGYETNYPPICLFGETVQLPPNIAPDAVAGQLFFSGNQIPENLGVISPLVFQPPLTQAFPGEAGAQ